MPLTDDRSWSEGADELGRLAQVIADTIEPEAARVDQEGQFPWKGLRALADAGSRLPAGAAGARRPRRLATRVLRRRTGAGLGGLRVDLHRLHDPAALRPPHRARTARREQRERWIPALCAAEAVGAIALTEPEAGSDVASMRTTARRDGDCYRINGSKIFISNGDVADVIVLFATVDPALGTAGHHRLPGGDAGAGGLRGGQADEQARPEGRLHGRAELRRLPHSRRRRAR